LARKEGALNRIALESDQYRGAHAPAHHRRRLADRERSGRAAQSLVTFHSEKHAAPSNTKPTGEGGKGCACPTRRARWLRLTTLVFLCFLAGALTWAPSSSDAVDQFGGLGSASGQFIEPQGVAVEQTSGDIYIVDNSNYRVERFTSVGVFLYAWGWGVADRRTASLQRCTTSCHMGLRGAGAGQLGFAEGIAVDNDPTSPSFKDVYVVDIGNLRVEKFNQSGEFLLMFGGGVNATAYKKGETADQDVCPVHPGDRCQAGSKGTADGQFSFRSEGDFVAAGPDGTVYVGDTNRVQEFSSSGAYQRQVSLPPPEGEDPETGGIPGVAVDLIGNIYVVRNGVAGVNEYSPAGELLRTLDNRELETTEGPTPTMALDAAGDVFINEHAHTQHRIVEYDPSGIEVASFDAGGGDGLHGIAFGDRAGRLYVVNTNNDVSPVVARVRVVAPPAPEPFAVCGCRRASGF
jgi:hypothetical protein